MLVNRHWPPAAASTQEDVKMEGDAAQDGLENVTENVWVKASLISVTMKGRDESTAVVELLDEPKTTFTCHLDAMRPVGEIKKDKQKPTKVHPATSPLGENMLPAFDYNAIDTEYKMAVAAHQLYWAMIGTASQLAYVQISQHSKNDTIPIVLTVRAKQKIKKGELVLFPLGGTMSPTGTETRKADCGAIHQAMLTEVPAWISITQQVPKKKDNKEQKAEPAAGASKEQKADNSEQEPAADDTVNTFRVASPLMQKKNHKHVLENLNPFWALVGAPGKQFLSNMQIEQVTITDSGPDLKQCRGVAMPRGFKVQTVISVARNTCVIEPGEVLTLPYGDV